MFSLTHISSPLHNSILIIMFPLPSYPSNISNDQDDWFDDPVIDMTTSPVGRIDHSMADKEWALMDEKFTNDGYREGILEGKLSTLQPGFDSGFTLAAPLARQFGNLKAQTSALLSMLNPPSGLRSKLPHMNTLLESIKDNSVTELKELSRELSAVRMGHLIGRDLEAEEHSKEHGIDIPVEHEGAADGKCEAGEGEKKLEKWSIRLEKIKKNIGKVFQVDSASSMEMMMNS